MPNMASEVSRHNSKLLRGSTQTQQQSRCSCDGGVPSCPVKGDCEKTGVVYQASVVESVTKKTQTYTGLTGRKFTKRY